MATKMSQTTNGSAKQRKSIFPVLTLALAFGLSLTYFSLFATQTTVTNQAGQTANVRLAQLLIPNNSAATPAGVGNPPAPGSNVGNPPLSVPKGSNQGLRDPLGNTNGNLSTFLYTLLDKVIIPLGAIVIVFAIIWAGFKYVTANGDTGKIAEAHKQLTWTAIGAAILLGAKAISMVITNTVNTLKS